MSKANLLTELGDACFVSDRHSLQIRTLGVQTMTGDLVLTLLHRNRQRLDPGGAGRNIDLPDAASSDGAWFEFTNDADAAESLTVRESVADGSATIVSVAQNRRSRVYCEAGAWDHSGLVVTSLT